ncbi:MAG TPA: D-tyrosyl-tRNA(Tyr) deacylase [Planctomycetes bacterium]|nr:D-tyrosyl-tRNA(Tyr) deacylase [Planctomycetota bacterium]
MRAVIQRVSKASVKVDGKAHSKIGPGIVVLLGVERGDGPADVEYMAEKVVNLRMFPDEDNRMNLSVLQAKGDALVVSQFTLAGDCRKGRRPSFDRAEEPAKSNALYQAFVSACTARGLSVKTGEFRASMDVSLVNRGPVTLLVSSRKEF